LADQDAKHGAGDADYFKWEDLCDFT
jgi:hypothetical protein